MKRLALAIAGAGAVALAGPASAAPSAEGSSPMYQGSGNLYVSASGNDRDGLNLCANASDPCTLQGAVNRVALSAAAEATPTIHIAHGAYASGVIVDTPKSLILMGDASSPASVVIADAMLGSPAAIVAENDAHVQLWGMTISSAHGSDIFPSFGAKIVIGTSMIFGASALGQMHAETGGAVEIPFSYTITGGAPAHWETVLGGRIIVDEATPVITLSGTPTFTKAFATCQDAGSLIYAPNANLSFSGSATGHRYDVQSNCTIETNAGAASFFPGDVGGVMSSGGKYLPIPTPTLAATGLGAGGGAGVLLVSGTDQQAPVIRLTAGTSGAGASGTLTINMGDGGAPRLVVPSCLPLQGTQTWPSTTTIQILRMTNNSDQLAFNTNGAVLAPGAYYLACQIDPR